MRVITLVVAIMVSAAPAGAQEWTEYISKEDGFRVNFPAPPKIETTTFKSEYGVDLPAKVYTVNRGVDRYSMIVADYSNIRKLADERAAKLCPSGKGDERSCGLVNAGRGYWKEELGGAMLHALNLFIMRDARITHMAFAWQDLIEGIEVQLTNNADKSRTFAYISMHKNKLYILEGTVPGNYPPPALFQQSMGYVDETGRGVRYGSIYNNLYNEWPKDFPTPATRTGGGGNAPAGGTGAAPQQGQ
jgi:hypothetical protein